MTANKSPTTNQTAQLVQLKTQVVLKLIDDAINGTGDKAEAEVALQNLCLSLIGQNQQLWQAFSIISEKLDIEKGDAWELSVQNKVQDLVDEREFLSAVLLKLRNSTPLTGEEELQLQAYLYME